MKLTVQSSYQIKKCRLYIDGKTVPLKNGSGRYTATVDTDEFARIEIYRVSELCAPLWSLRAVFFWLIGILGLFTPRYDKLAHRLLYSLELQMTQDATVTLDVVPLAKNASGEIAPAVTMVSNVPYREQGNVYMPDPLAAKRRRAYTALSWLSRIAIIVGVAVGIVFWIIG